MSQENTSPVGITIIDTFFFENLKREAGKSQNAVKQGVTQKERTPCDETQGVLMDVNSIERNHEKPLFLGTETGSADGRCPEFCPDCDKIELILSLIDSLTFEEKERLFDRLDSVER
ncbi:MAG: hypothetical protein IJF84_09130 [Thermoguttaceae bacterium]|nr:hypothetical protein [Thermoguttaceae bacterium]